MSQFKSIIFITAIGMLVLFSGCAGPQEKNTQEKPTPTGQPTISPSPPVTPAVQAPPFQIQVTGTKTIDDCIVAYGSKQSCFLINLEVSNNIDKSADFILLTDVVVTKGDKADGARYDTQIGLSNLCVRPSGLAFNLDARTSKTIGMCYPPVSKSDIPVLKMAAMINGERKEYTFDVSK